MNSFEGDGTAEGRPGEGRSVEPLAPYQYELVHVLLVNSYTARELSERYPAYVKGWDGRRIAGVLRPLVARGWVLRSESGVYSASDRAREAVSW